MKPELANYSQVYIIYSPTAVTTPEYPSKGYAGPTGRLDVLARAALAVEPGSLLILVPAGPPRGETLLAYDPASCRITSERQAMEELRRALAGRGDCVSLIDYSFERVLFLASKTHELVYLREDGDPGPHRARGRTYVLGSHVDLPAEVEAMVLRYAGSVESIGVRSYHTSHVIAYLEWTRLYC